MTLEVRRSAVLTTALVILLAALALGLRLPELDSRPMHTDEAVHTIKAGGIIEHGKYEYDPNEYHGPTIYYFALPFVWLQGAETLAETNEWTFRLVPVIFGVGLILLLLFIKDGIGPWECVVAAALTALSPAMVFYSRYYIQEMLLVFFTFGVIVFLWRHVQSRGLLWAVLAGVCAGLMHATKETCIITYAAIAGAFVLAFAWTYWHDGTKLNYSRTFKKRYLAAALIILFFVSAPLLSGFFTNPGAELDAWLSYTKYFHRASGEGIHQHPWHYYLGLLLYTKYAPGPWWSEGLILGLACVGAVACLRRRIPEGAPDKVRQVVSLGRIFVFYVLLLVLAYSVIPYKTPWCLLSFLHGMIILAGIGAVALVRKTPTLMLKGVVCVLLVLGAYQLGGQAYRASYTFSADTRNPYVYGHTAGDLMKFVAQIDEMEAVYPKGKGMLVKVITTGGDCWPLPWYLRGLDRVGYWTSVPDDVDGDIVVTSVDLEDAVTAELTGDYQTEYFGLRPEVLIAVFVKRDLWDAFIEARSKPS